MKASLITALTLSLTAVTHVAWAGRPLATDDAATTDARTCQVESWLERAGSERALVFAPACGIAEGLELGADYTRTRAHDTSRTAGFAVKWVPGAWRVDTRAGELHAGLKWSTALERPAQAGWRRSETGVLALATWKPGGAWSLHANLGVAHERSSDTTAALLNLAVDWAVHPDALLFAESQANDRQAVFGGTVTTAGGRWWLVRDQLGLDLTASRETGVGSTLWTVGLGWYGIGF